MDGLTNLEFGGLDGRVSLQNRFYGHVELCRNGAEGVTFDDDIICCGGRERRWPWQGLVDRGGGLRSVGRGGHDVRRLRRVSRLDERRCRVIRWFRRGR